MCTGSVALSENAPRTTSVYAAEGTFAHHIGSTCLKDKKFRPEDWRDITEKVDGHDITCSQDMIDAVNEYLAIVYSKLSAKDTLFVEQDFTPALIKLHPDFEPLNELQILL